MSINIERIHSTYARVLQTCVPWVATTKSSSAADLDTEAFGFKSVARYDPQKLADATFLDLVQRLDEKVYATEGMKMPRWVFYDCTAAPGALVGFAQDVDDLDPRVHDLLELPAGFTGLVPVACYFMIPMLEPGAWQNVAHVTVETLCAGALPTGTARLAAAFGLKAVRAETLYASVQWRAHELRHHARYAPLEILSAWTPAHTLAETLVFRTKLDDGQIENSLLQDPIAASEGVDADDPKALKEIQRRVESGEKLYVTGGPVTFPGRTVVPVEAL